MSVQAHAATPPPDALSPERPWRRALQVLLLAAALVVVLRGWSAAGLDPTRLAQVLGAMPHPELTSRQVSPVELQLVIVVGAGSNGPAIATAPSGQQSLRVLPGSPNPGQTIAFDGSGFGPGANGELRVVNPSRQIDRVLLPVHTDGQGGFHLQSAWPDYATLPPDIYQLQLNLAAPAGSAGPGESLRNGLTVVGEVLLLALLGTLLGVAITRAVGLSAWLVAWAPEVALVGVLLVGLVGVLASVVVIAVFCVGKQLSVQTVVRGLSLAALLAVVGSGGLGSVLSGYLGQQQLERAATTVWVALFVLVLGAVAQRATTISRSLSPPNGARS